MTPRAAAPVVDPAPKAVKKRAPRGTVSTSQRKDGIWQASVELSNKNGERQRKYFYGKTQRAALLKANAARAKVDAGRSMRTSTPTVNSWLDYWLSDIAQLKPRTKVMYAQRLQYVRHVIGTVKLEALEPLHVREVTEYCLKERGLASTTARNTQSILSSALDAAVRDEVIDRNVARIVKAPPRNVPNVSEHTVDEARAVLREVSLMVESPTPGGAPTPKYRNAARWWYALLTGGRQGETLGLTWDRIDFDRNRIDLSWQLQRLRWEHGCHDGSRAYAPKDERPCGYIRGAWCPKKHFDIGPQYEFIHLVDAWHLTRPKTAAGTRIVKLDPALKEVLLLHRELTKDDPNPHNLVFTSAPKKMIGGDRRSVMRLREDPELDGKPIDSGQDVKDWHALCRAAGVREIRVHDIRRTAVTLLIDLGVPPEFVKDIVGHSTILSTLAYRGQSLAASEAALAALGRALTAPDGAKLGQVGSQITLTP